MINDEQVRPIALFFLFCLMDEKVALQAAHKAVAHLKATAQTGESQIPFKEQTLISVLHSFYLQFTKFVPRNRPVTVPSSSWVPADRVDLAPWARFQKDAGEHEIVAVVLSRILGFGDEAIAAGLGLSLGTVRYRIGKGMRQLGSYAKSARA